MTIRQFKTIQKQIETLLKVAENDARKLGLDITSAEFLFGLDELKRKALETRGFTVADYEELEYIAGSEKAEDEGEMKTIFGMKVNVKLPESEKKAFRKETWQEMQRLKEEFLLKVGATEKAISELKDSFAFEIDVIKKDALTKIHVRDIVSEMLPYVPPAYEPKESDFPGFLGGIESLYDSVASLHSSYEGITKDMGEKVDSLSNTFLDFKTKKPIFSEEEVLSLKGLARPSSLQENIEMYTMEPFRKLALGLQTQIDSITGSDIEGPGSSTDNAVVRWNGTGGSKIQDTSGVVIDDSFNVDIDGTLTLGSSGIQVSTSAGLLRHEAGGIELDISSISTGDVLAGASSGVMEIVDGGSASDGDVLTIQADGTVNFEAAPGAGSIGGSTGSVDNALLRANGTGGSTLQAASATATLSDNNDLTLYDATNNGNPVFAFGAAAAERLTITPTFDSGAQTLDYVLFETNVASGTADKGELRFQIDEALVATIDDGGIELADAMAYHIDTSDVLNETTLGSTVVTSSLTTVGALNSGSITSGFGAIDVGASAIAGGSFDASEGNITNVGDIGLDSLTADDAGIAINSDVFTANATGIVIGHTAQITANNAAEFQIIGTGGADSANIIARFSSNDKSGLSQFVKSRNGTPGSHTIVQDDDKVGEIAFFPDDGVDYATKAARWKVEVDDASPAAGDIGMAFVWEQMAGGGASSAETMRLDAAGNLTLSSGASIYIKEKADATGDVAAYGQIWVDTATPNVFMFTDDAGTDFTIANNATTTLSSLVTVGTIGSGTWEGTTIAVDQGGTGATTLADGYVLLGSGTGAITALNVTVKGSILVGDGSGDPVALAVGDDDQVLTADSGEASGLKWATAGGGGDLEVWLKPSSGADGSGVERTTDGFQEWKFNDGGGTSVDTTVKAPAGATSISSIKVLYSRNATGNLYIAFNFNHLDVVIGDTFTSDSEAVATYAGGSSNGSLGIITIPSTGYNGLTITEGDIIGLQINRQGAHANDTYGTTFRVYGILYTFA